MTTDVAPAADFVTSLDASDARKRRREILTNHRALSPEDDDSTMMIVSDSETGHKSKKHKKQQKYDPGVPMTKDQAAAWRREQRRKRNRESAAASRQRQRDRIEELEAEVQEWQRKYETIMEQVRMLKQQQGITDVSLVNTAEQPPFAPPSSLELFAPPSPVSPFDYPLVVAGVNDEHKHQACPEEKLPPKMTSRPA
jgi:hypothetical protein